MKYKKLIIPALVLIGILIVVIRFGPAITGNVSYLLDNSKPICLYNDIKYNYFIENIDTCCKEVEKQLVCQGENPVICFVKAGGTTYQLNNKAWHYCEIEGYNINK